MQGYMGTVVEVVQILRVQLLVLTALLPVVEEVQVGRVALQGTTFLRLFLLLEVLEEMGLSLPLQEQPWYMEQVVVVVVTAMSIA